MKLRGMRPFVFPQEGASAMLAFLVTDKLCRRRPKSPQANGASRRHLQSHDRRLAVGDSAAAAVPQGIRYQVLRALRAMARGEMMVVERRAPSLAGHFANAAARESWFKSLRPAASWQDVADIEPIVVPGTAFPGLIGRILLRNGWSAPSGTPHWVPNLRFFRLSDVGYKAFSEAQAWWQSLTPTQRLRLALAE